jgi:hypothetical protein
LAVRSFLTFTAGVLGARSEIMIVGKRFFARCECFSQTVAAIQVRRTAKDEIRKSSLRTFG